MHAREHSSAVERCRPHVAISSAMLRSSNAQVVTGKARGAEQAQKLAELEITRRQRAEKAALKRAAVAEQVRERSSAVEHCGPHVAISPAMYVL